MKIGAALAADLDILTEALDEPGADVLQTLHQLSADAQAAVPTYLGLSATVGNSDPPFTLTTLEDGSAADVRTSLCLTLRAGAGAGAGAGDGRASPSVALVLYAGTSGTFVDLTADLAWLLGRRLSDFALDQHLSRPTIPDAGTYLRSASVINQAIGVLIGRGYTPERAHRELDTQTDSARSERHTMAQFILDTLTAEDPAEAEHPDQEPDIG